MVPRSGITNLEAAPRPAPFGPLALCASGTKGLDLAKCPDNMLRSSQGNSRVKAGAGLALGGKL
jgi:hypothetical protein